MTAISVIIVMNARIAPTVRIVPTARTVRIAPTARIAKILQTVVVVLVSKKTKRNKKIKPTNQRNKTTKNIFFYFGNHHNQWPTNGHPNKKIYFTLASIMPYHNALPYFLLWSPWSPSWSS